MKILIVEDDKTCSEMIQLFLKQEQSPNIEFVAAHNLTQGIEQSLQGVFDLIILDLVLPESVDPKETLVKFSDAMKKIPTIVMSGAGDAATGLLSIEYGAKDYITKPNMDRLKAAIGRIFPAVGPTVK